MARNDELKLNQINATAQDADLASLVGAREVVLRMVVPTGSAAAPYTFSAPYDMYVTGAEVQCLATSSSGTLTLRVATTAITDAIACATNHAIDYAATIDDAQSLLVAGTTYNIVANGATDTGVFILRGIRV